MICWDCGEHVGDDHMHREWRMWSERQIRQLEAERDALRAEVIALREAWRTVNEAGLGNELRMRKADARKLLDGQREG